MKINITKRICYVTIIPLLLITIIACNNKTEPESTLVIEEFSISNATDMIKELEQPIIHIASQKRITREEFNAIETELDELFHYYSETILNCFFDLADIENKERKKMNVIQVFFYPTIYHKDIEIVDAYIEKYTNDDPFWNTERLLIELKYTGDDPLLKDFERTYHFSKDEQGEWFVDGFSGMLNLAEDDKFHPSYLELKTDEQFITPA